MILEKIRKFLGFPPPTNYAALIANGAIIVDVRSPSEFKSGHIKGAVNVPLERVLEDQNLSKIKQKTLILCCRSGMRSAAAKSKLETKGFASVYNGGAWQTLQSKLNQQKAS